MKLTRKSKFFHLFSAGFGLAVFVVFLFFLNTQYASASGKCQSMDSTFLSKYNGQHTISVKSKDECDQICKGLGINERFCFYIDDGAGTNLNDPLSDNLNKVVDSVKKGESGNVGEKDVCSWSAWADHPINCSLAATLQFVGSLLPVSSTIFSWGADTNSLREVIDGPAIYPTWQKVRDILNIFFIIILLFSAFATIFQVEQYNYKKILLTLVIMALLVNFSFPITRFIIDVSNTMMYTIIQNLLPDKETTFSVITKNSGITAILNPVVEKVSASYLLSAIIFVFILAITLMAISVLLIIRMIALAILIIFSPIAFVGSILPGAGKYSGEWWDKLFKYSFFGPIMLFMVYVAVVMMNTMASQQAFKIFSEAKNQTVEPTIVGSIAYFSIPIIILWMGIGIAQGMSITGASAVMGQAQKFMGWAGKTFSGYRAGKWFATKAVPGMAKHGVEKFEESVLAPHGLSPRAFIKGWKARSAEAERKALEPAAGDWHDRLNRWISGGTNKTHFGNVARQANILKKQKELSDTDQNSESLYREFENAEKSSDAEKMSAVLRVMFNNNDQNEFMKLSGEEVDPSNMREFIYKRLTKAKMKEEEAAKQLSDLSEIAVSKGNFANYGMAYFDVDKGHYVKNKDEDEFLSESGKKVYGQFAAAAGKARNIKAQTKADLWHWNSFLTETANGEVGDLHDFGRKQLKNLTIAEVNSAPRVRNDFYKILEGKGKKEIQDYADELRKVNKEQAEIIDSFIATLQAGKFTDKRTSEKKEDKPKA